MCKFKEKDVIKSIPGYKGFEEATVLGVFTDTEKFQGKKMYLLQIPCGTATLPVSMEDNYKLKYSKNKVEV